MLYFIKLFADVVRHFVRCENIRFVILYGDIAYLIAFDSEVHQRAQKITVSKDVGKLSVQRGDFKYGYRKTLIPPYFVFVPEPRHISFGQFCSAVEYIFAKFTFHALDIALLSRRQKRSKKIPSALFGP